MFRLEIETGNAAFDGSPYLEISAILAKLSERMISEWVKQGVIKDANGATVGMWQYFAEEES